MPTPRCPACKIILDGGRLAAAATMLANRSQGALHVAATYLADIVRASTSAIEHGIELSQLTAAQIDERHAWSELQCHRAQFIEDNIGRGAFTPEDLIAWAHEDRLHATALAGGEYEGEWEVLGTSGIRKKSKPAE